MDHLKRKLYVSFELKILLLRSIITNNYILPIIRFYALFKLSLLPKFKLITRQKNRCIFLGRSYSILRKFKLSRWELKKKASFGLISNVIKGSW